MVANLIEAFGNNFNSNPPFVSDINIWIGNYTPVNFNIDYAGSKQIL